MCGFSLFEFPFSLLIHYTHEEKEDNPAAGARRRRLTVFLLLLAVKYFQLFVDMSISSGHFTPSCLCIMMVEDKKSHLHQRAFFSGSKRVKGKTLCRGLGR